mmetsp:Transcript_85135/g.214671  ORF Transcript_85135/g.214671 Transcript_85135/m.214671 type:complete len:230 (+) Transcript_85135:222-911(+)
MSGRLGVESAIGGGRSSSRRQQSARATQNERHGGGATSAANPGKTLRLSSTRWPGFWLRLARNHPMLMRWPSAMRLQLLPQGTWPQASPSAVCGGNLHTSRRRVAVAAMRKASVSAKLRIEASPRMMLSPCSPGRRTRCRTTSSASGSSRRASSARKPPLLPPRHRPDMSSGTTKRGRAGVPPGLSRPSSMSRQPSPTTAALPTWTAAAAPAALTPGRHQWLPSIGGPC